MSCGVACVNNVKICKLSTMVFICYVCSSDLKGGFYGECRVNGGHDVVLSSILNSGEIIGPL